MKKSSIFQTIFALIFILGFAIGFAGLQYYTENIFLQFLSGIIVLFAGLSGTLSLIIVQMNYN